MRFNIEPQNTAVIKSKAVTANATASGQARVRLASCFTPLPATPTPSLARYKFSSKAELNADPGCTAEINPRYPTACMPLQAGWFPVAF